MNNKGISNPEYFDLPGMLFDGQQFMLEAYARGSLPIGFWTKDEVARLDRLHKGGILNDRRVSDDWRTALDEFFVRRKVGPCSEDEIKEIVDIWCRQPETKTHASSPL